MTAGVLVAGVGSWRFAVFTRGGRVAVCARVDDDNEPAALIVSCAPPLRRSFPNSPKNGVKPRARAVFSLLREMRKDSTGGSM